MSQATDTQPQTAPYGQPWEVIETAEIRVGCDGGGGALGHPLVYLDMHDGRVQCPYCSRLFLLKHD